jgi:hypothetical protein
MPKKSENNVSAPIANNAALDKPAPSVEEIKAQVIAEMDTNCTELENRI